MHAPHASGASVDVTEAITLVSATEGSQADEESPADGDQSLDAEDESQDADLDSRDADDESQTAKGSQAAEGSRASPETLDDLNWSEQPRHHRYRDNNNTTTNNDDDVSVTDKGSDVARSDVAVSDVAVSDIVGMMDNHRLEQKAPSVAESTESQYLPLIRTAVERIGPSKRGDFPKVKVGRLSTLDGESHQTQRMNIDIDYSFCSWGRKPSGMVEPRLTEVSSMMIASMPTQPGAPWRKTMTMMTITSLTIDEPSSCDPPPRAKFSVDHHHLFFAFAPKVWLESKEK